MGINVELEITPETVEFCAAMLFLIVDLLVVSAVIGNIIVKIDNQQYLLTTMTNANTINAPIYEHEAYMNQGIWVIMGFAFLIFLAYISKEPLKKIKLIKDIVKRK